MFLFLLVATLGLGFLGLHYNYAIGLVMAVFLISGLYLTHSFALLLHWSLTLAPAEKSLIVTFDLVANAFKVVGAACLCLNPASALLYECRFGLVWFSTAH